MACDILVTVLSPTNCELGLDFGLRLVNIPCFADRWTQLHTNTNNAIISGLAYSTGRLLAAGRSVHDWVSFLRPVCPFPGNLTLASCLDRGDKNILYLTFIFLILISSYDVLN